MTITELQSLPDTEVTDLMLANVFPNWKVTHRTSLGFRGEANDPTRCPLRQTKCDDCRWFAGHETKGCDGIVGSSLPTCCGLMMLSSDQQEGR